MLEQRIAALEARLEEIKKGVTGPRGPAGDINAAVLNAKIAVNDAESRVQARADATYARFAADLATVRNEIRQLKQYLDDGIKNAVDSATVEVLHAYHLLDENNAPAHWTNSTHTADVSAKD